MKYVFCPQCGGRLIDVELGERLRAACADPACGYVHWDNPVPVVAALIECVDRDGQILLARNAAWQHRMFALITGFMEAGETPQDGITREVKEETALDAFCLLYTSPSPRD